MGCACCPNSIRQQIDGNLTFHLVRSSDCFFERQVLRVTNRSHTLLGGCAVRNGSVNIDQNLAAVQCAALNAVIDLSQTADDFQSAFVRCFGELALSFAVSNIDRILQYFGAAGFLNVERCFVAFCRIECTTRSINCVARCTVLVIYIEELARAVKRAVSVLEVAGIRPHGVIRAVDTRLRRSGSVEGAAFEAHISIAGQPAVNRAAIHRDGAGVLEAMIVNVSKVKCHILECGTVRNTTNTASRCVFEHDTIGITLYSDILRKIG